MTQHTKVNICLIGTGRAGMIHARNLISKINHACLAAICDVNPENLLKVQQELQVSKTFIDYHEALADDEIDAVIIVTPTVLHREIVLAAAAAKKDIFCEKPLAMTVAECDEMIAAAKANHVKLQVGFMRRFDESFQEAKRQIDEGAIGSVVMIKSLTHGPSKPQPWMFDISKSNGPIGEVNSHDLDTLRWFANSEIAEVYALGGNFRSPQVKAKYPSFYDTVAMNLKFADGKLGLIDGAQYVQYGYDARVEILGTDGIMQIGTQTKYNVVTVNRTHHSQRTAMNSWRYLFRNAYVAEDQAFVDAILNDTQPLVTGEDGKMAVKLVDAGLESLLQHRVVKIGEDN